MKTAVVIFSHNATVHNNWENILKSYSVQDIPERHFILVDSESTDSTVELAAHYGWEIISIKASDFNHGLTRNKAVCDLVSKNFDTAVFATQDVLLASESTIKTLVDCLEKENASAAYARQIPFDPSGFDGFFRQLNYPEKSIVKTKEDIPVLGLMTPFCSNSLAAWNLKKVSAAGGFTATSFGEDILTSAKLIMQGEKILYCAESKCYHQHNSSMKELFSRGAAVGKLHAGHPELARDFGKAESCAISRIPLKVKLRFFFPLAVKYLGFVVGKFICRNSQ